MNKEEFVALYEKYLAGKCTAEEIEMLQSHHDEEIVMPENLRASSAANRRLYRNLRKKIRNSIPDQYALTSERRLLWLKIAAMFLVILSIALYFLPSRQPATRLVYSAKANDSKIIPGGNKAYLTTSNGTVITLDDLKNGRLSIQTGTDVSKVKDGVLQYDQKTGKRVEDAAMAYNTITIPRGGQYQLILSDGTKVWLNSASSLKYPVAFSGNERAVQLSGEAYFEVAKNRSKPFNVSLNGLKVQVLGTHFNITAYSDEKAIKTTLLEGSVKLIAENRNVVLRPGEQGILIANSESINVQEVDSDEAVAWKEGYFVFNNEDLHEIMKRISRWYDVDVVFPKNFKRANFGGTVSRFKDVSQVLNSLELTGSVHFKIEERRIIVMP